MLVLSRKVGEQVFVGSDLIITVVDIDRGKIRLGFQAPNSTPIARGELLSPGQREEARRTAGVPPAERARRALEETQSGM